MTVWAKTVLVNDALIAGVAHAVGADQLHFAAVD
jgi:hypothetical protein